MSDAVIVGLLALLGTIFTAVWQNKKLGDDFQKRSELADAAMNEKISVYAAKTDAKIDALTKSVNEHNQFARRVPVLEEKMKVTEHRLADLERGK